VELGIRVKLSSAVAVALSCTGLLPVHAAPSDDRAARAPSDALTHVTVVDPATGLHPGCTVLVTSGRVVAVGPDADVALPPGATVHDGSGRFVIPGLWDAHVHLTQAGAAAFPLLVANGVTSVRDMGSDLTEIRRWQAARLRAS
jgi:predicted amidohydrolase YtcJ